MSRKFNDEEEREIYKQHWEEGISTYTLGRRWGCHNTTIWHVLNRVGEARKHVASLNTDSYFELQKENNAYYTPGKEHPTYKDGRTKYRYKILLLERGIHPFPICIKHSNIFMDGIYEHRLNMEQELKNNDPNSKFLIAVESFEGKWLDPKILIHHKNGIMLDNKVENLECMTKKEHNAFHRKNKKRFVM